MKRNNSSIGKLEYNEPASGRKLKSIQLEFIKNENFSLTKALKKSEQDNRSKQHKKALSSAEITQMPQGLKIKLTNNSVKQLKSPINPNDNEKKPNKTNSLIFPPIETNLPQNPEKKLKELKEKFQIFKKNMGKVQSSVRKYKKSYKKVNKFVQKRRKNLFSRRIVMQTIFNAWKNQVKHKRNANPQRKLLK